MEEIVGEIQSNSAHIQNIYSSLFIFDYGDSNTRSTAGTTPPSGELIHSHSSPNLLVHDTASDPISSPSFLSPLSHNGSISAPTSPTTSSTPSLHANAPDSDLTYEQRMRKKLIAEIVTTEIDYVKGI